MRIDGLNGKRHERQLMWFHHEIEVVEGKEC